MCIRDSKTRLRGGDLVAQGHTEGSGGEDKEGRDEIQAEAEPPLYHVHLQPRADGVIDLFYIHK